MILIISTCSQKLSEEEFVKPLTRFAGDYEVRHYTENIDVSGYDKIIIAGTALIDNDYIENLEKFMWLNDFDKPVLGICSGMQIIALVNNAAITNSSKEIGVVKIKTIKKNILFSGDFEAFAIHGNSVDNLDRFEILAKSEKCVHAIKLNNKDHYGLLFHPEVMNHDIISKFMNNLS